MKLYSDKKNKLLHCPACGGDDFSETNYSKGESAYFACNKCKKVSEYKDLTEVKPVKKAEKLTSLWD